jgi:peroxiredoxin Q/BCP
MNNANATGSAASDGTETLLRAGAQLPDVSARTQKGETIKFSDLRGKPVVVYFYPKDDTPGCTVEAKDIRDTWKDIQSLGATVIGVSVDDDASHKAFAEKYGLPFLLVADTDHHVASAFGVPLRNGRARRVSFVFDKTGRLTKVFPDVTPQGHGGELLAALRGS